MKPKKRIFVLALIMTVATTSQVLATEKTVTKEYTFFSDTPKFHYRADKEIKEGGRTYTLDTIDYQILRTEDTYLSKEVSYKNLIKKQIPTTKKFKINGKTVTLYADQADIRYSETIKATTEHRFDDTATPDFPEQKRVMVKGKRCKAKLIGVKEREKNKPFAVMVKFIGAPRATFYFEGQKIQLNKDEPTWKGYEQAVKSHLSLDEGCRLTGGTWTSGWRNEKGKPVRYARFTGTRPVSDYVATYAYKVYDATVIYDNQREPGEKEYTVKAVCTYEKKGFSLFQKVLCTGVGIVLFALLTVLSLYVISRKRKKAGGI